PFMFGCFEGVFIDHEKFPELNQTLQEIADRYEVDKSAIAVAWILRHLAQIQTIVGTMNPGRLKNIVRASHIVLTREEWYQIYQAAGNKLPSSNHDDLAVKSLYCYRGYNDRETLHLNSVLMNDHDRF